MATGKQVVIYQSYPLSVSTA